VSHVTRGTSAATQAGHTHRRSTLSARSGLPDTVENTSWSRSSSWRPSATPPTELQRPPPATVPSGRRLRFWMSNVPLVDRFADAQASGLFVKVSHRSAKQLAATDSAVNRASPTRVRGSSHGNCASNAVACVRFNAHLGRTVPESRHLDAAGGLTVSVPNSYLTGAPH